jgi:predicted glycosyltransferase involved in capsule biosynthesis
MDMKYIAVQRNVVPIMFPCFRGLAKLWNNIIITASNDYILVLNDDTQITEEAFFQRLIACLMQNKFRSFKINGCWSHVLLNKWEVDQVGYFDERLLGIGEEDHDFEWRYGKILKREFVSYKLSGIKNCCDMSYAPANIRIGLFNKYSHFNNHFIFTKSIKSILIMALGMGHGRKDWSLYWIIKINILMKSFLETASLNYECYVREKP